MPTTRQVNVCLGSGPGGRISPSSMLLATRLTGAVASPAAYSSTSPISRLRFYGPAGLFARVSDNLIHADGSRTRPIDDCHA